MTHLERSINESLERWPRVKAIVKDCYQFLGSMVPVRTIQPEQPPQVRRGYFFGFHDLCPWSRDGTAILAHDCGALPVRTPRRNDSVTVGYFSDPELSAFVPLAATCAFNWQEGARLQWVGDGIMFNTIDDRGRAFARRVDRHGQNIADYDDPIGCADPDGRLAAAYDFGRLRHYDAAYSYAGASVSDGGSRPRDDGLRIMDLATGRSVVAVSLAELASLQPEPGMETAYHYVSHCQFSPDGHRISFMHCWMMGRRRLSRLFCLELAASRLTLCRDLHWVSHHCWRGNDRIVAFAASRGRRRGFQFVDPGKGESVPIAGDMPGGDGHPQMDVSGRWLLVDTYPDRHLRQHLLLCDLRNGEVHRLLSFRIPRRFRHGLRCDFHPRWNRTCDAICFDSPHPGVRSLCTLQLRSPEASAD